MHLKSREYLAGVPKLLIEITVGVCCHARLESLIDGLMEDTAHSSVEKRFYLSFDIKLSAVDVAECPYKQFLVELQVGYRCVVRIEVGLIDYQSK